MTESQLSSLLEVHDRLVAACVEGSMPPLEFWAAYGDFYNLYALGGFGASPEQRALFRRYGERIAFHRRVTSILSGGAAAQGRGDGDYTGADRFLPEVLRMRLRQLVAQYPAFKVAAATDVRGCAR